MGAKGSTENDCLMCVGGRLHLRRRGKNTPPEGYERIKLSDGHMFYAAKEGEALETLYRYWRKAVFAK
jgi:hypothetical protein